MKNAIFYFLLLITGITSAQTYPFIDGFESYTNFTTLGTQGGYLSDMSIYQTHGMGSSKGLISQISNFNTRDTTVTPLIGPLTATSRLTFYYRIVDQSLYPATATALGSNDKVEIFAGNQSLGLYQSIYSITQANHTASTAFKKVAIPVGALAGQSGNLKIVITKGTATDYFVDIDSLVVMDSVTLVTPLALTGTKTDAACFNACTGGINLTATGGTTPYTYSWNSALPGTATQSNLCAGTYQVTVTDNAGASVTATYTITQPAGLQLTHSITAVQCYGQASGCIDVTVTGGISPYTYSWSNTQSTEDICNVPAGAYVVSVTDANQCTITDNYTVGEPQQLSFTATGTDPTAAAATDGSIILQITGGTAPYTTSLDNGTFSTTTTYNALAQGCYILVVKDSLNCTAEPDTVCLTAPTAIGQENPEALSVFPTCADAVITIQLPGVVLQQLSVYNATGQLMLTLIPQTTTCTISTAEFPSGSYIVRLKAQDAWLQRRILVQH